MDREFLSGARGTPPSRPSSPSVGYPTNGNPATGVATTVPGDWFYYMITEELRGIVAAAGITPDASNVSQVLAALRSAGVFQTAPKFDNTTKAATTAFVRGEGLQGSNVVAIGSMPLAVTSSHAGAILYTTTGAGVVNLPDATTWPAGKALVIQAAVATTINRNGTQLIYCNSAGQASVSLGDGDSITLYAVPMFSGWVAVGNSGQLGKSAAFASSIGASGYQKLPSGIIVQWGQITNSATIGNPTAVTFPMAFPNGCRQLTVSAINAATANSAAWYDTPTVNGFNSRAAAASLVSSYIAIGN